MSVPYHLLKYKLTVFLFVECTGAGSNCFSKLKKYLRRHFLIYNFRSTFLLNIFILFCFHSFHWKQKNIKPIKSNEIKLKTVAIYCCFIWIFVNSKNCCKWAETLQATNCTQLRFSLSRVTFVGMTVICIQACCLSLLFVQSSKYFFLPSARAVFSYLKILILLDVQER